MGQKQIAEAMIKLTEEMEVYRNEIIEEVASRLEQEFVLPFGEDTVASFVVYIRGMKR